MASVAKKTLLSALQKRCHDRIFAQMQNSIFNGPSPRLNRALKYAVESRGKMIRPMLTFASAELLDFNNQQCIDSIATSVEFIHIYSLIHDDLPSMDDDTLRRGRNTLHIEYDEATAILVGGCLQSMAFQQLSTPCDIAADRQLAMVHRLSQACGSDGLISGQMLDLYQGKVDIDYLQQMHSYKTGALISAAIILPAIAAGTATETVARLQKIAAKIGLAFQVADDILDVEKTTAELGKTANSDRVNDTVTYASLLGVTQSRQVLQDLCDDCKSALADFKQSKQLRNIVDFIAQSTN